MVRCGNRRAGGSCSADGPGHGADYGCSHAGFVARRGRRRAEGGKERSPKYQADRARDAHQWEQAPRFYVDALEQIPMIQRSGLSSAARSGRPGKMWKPTSPIAWRTSSMASRDADRRCGPPKPRHRARVLDRCPDQLRGSRARGVGLVDCPNCNG